MMKYDLLLVGGSAGGVDAFQRLLKKLPVPLPVPMVFIHHVLKEASINYQNVYGHSTSMPITEIEEKMQLEAGRVYFAAPDYHTLIEKNLTVSLDFSEPVNYSRPSIDVTFSSVAEEIECRAIAVLMTGASEDGARGLAELKKAGAYIIVQAPEDAQMTIMPEAALRLSEPNFTGTVEEIAEHLCRMLNLKDKVGVLHESC